MNMIEQLKVISNAAQANEQAQARTAIENAKRILKDQKNLESNDLRQLDQELSVWLSKLDVIFQEPVGRQGLARHTDHWIQKLS